MLFRPLLNKNEADFELVNGGELSIFMFA